ncbi:MAG: LuxR C-terminal-related transcriptional regulator, partial [Flavobacteriaceae bacterium]
GLYYNNMFAGNLARAKRNGHKVKTIGAKNDLHYTHAMGVCQEAMACFCANQLEDAIGLLKIAEQKRFILHKGTAIDAMAAKVIAHEIQNQPKEADATLKTLKAFTAELNQDAYAIVSSSCEMRLLSMRNKMEKAMKWQSLLEQTPIFASLFIWIEVPRLTQVRVLLRASSEKSLDKATMILAEVNEIAKHYHLINHQIEIAVLKVVLLIKRGMLTEAAKALDIALLLSEPGHWIRPYLEWKSELYPLLTEVCSHKGVPYFYKLLLKSLNKSMGTKSNELAAQVKPVEMAEDNEEQLSVREIDVVRLMSQGFRNKEIADTLFISVGTVKKHIYNIGQKWELHNRIAISRRATELSYV